MQELDKYYRDQGRRQLIADLLQDQYPVLYAMWVTVQPSIYIKPVKQGGQVCGSSERTSHGIAFLLEVPWKQVQEMVDAFEGLVQKALLDRRIVEKLEKQEAAQFMKDLQDV